MSYLLGHRVQLGVPLLQGRLLLWNSSLGLLAPTLALFTTIFAPQNVRPFAALNNLVLILLREFGEPPDRTGK